MKSTILPLICLLPVLSQAKVWVELRTDKNDPQREVTINGKSTEPLTNEEIKHLKLTEPELQDKIEDAFGRKPDEVFLQGPTPYGDLYASYGWSPVVKKLQATRAKVMTINSGSSIISTRIFQNDQDEKASFDSLISQPLQNSVMSTWTAPTDIKMDADIQYSFDINDTSISGIHQIEYLSMFGNGYDRTFPAVIGSKTLISLSLEPNRKIVGELYATKQIMSVNIDYMISLDGTVATNYDASYRNHHFWGLDINKVMENSKPRPEILASESIKVTYFTDPKLVLRDAYNNKEIDRISLKFV